MGPDSISKWLKHFQLDEPTHIDLPYEKSGVIGDRVWKKKVRKQAWYGGDTLNLSIGQGSLVVSPLEITVAMNAFANNGFLIRPRLLKKVEGMEHSSSQREQVRLSPKTLQVIRQALRGVVKSPHGTAHLLEGLKLGLAGKTGTPQVSGKKSHGWFVGFFPYKEPRYTICVLLEHAGSSYEALRATKSFLSKLKEDNLIKTK